MGYEIIHITKDSTIPFLEPKTNQGPFFSLLTWHDFFWKMSIFFLGRNVKCYEKYMGVSLNDGTSKTPQNDHFL